MENASLHNISDGLSLTGIIPADHQCLYDLIVRIYPPVYAHLWPDQGRWYLDTMYAKDSLKEDLKDPDSRYYFVSYNDETIGILRLLLNNPLPGSGTANGVKLHRIYLDPTILGKGIGRKIMAWVENTFCCGEGSLLWLEVMDSQDPAIRFYKSLGFSIVGDFRLGYELMFEHFRGMYTMAKEIT